MDRRGGTRDRELLVSGHVNVDRFLELPEFPPNDRTVPVLRQRVVLGGTAGNIARAAARRGVRTGLIARVGEGFPLAFRRTLERDGIDLRGLIEMRPGPTPTAYILEDSRHRQRTLMEQGVMGDGIRDGSASRPWLKDYAWLHLTTGPPDLQLSLVDAARTHGIRVAADPAQEVQYRWDRAQLRRLVYGSEILFGNRRELSRVAAMLGVGRVERLVDRVPLVVRTEGDQGASAFSRTGTVHVASRRPRRITTVVGAGDAFRGGFYADWFRGEALDRCLRAGTDAAVRAMEGAPPRRGD
jgi:sugar/nucleoside kinase (ribokinase family)